MDRKILMLLIGLFFGGGIGFLIAASNGITLDGHDHATGHGGGHNHAAMVPIVLAEDSKAPTLSAEVIKDPASGWNLKIDTTNFRFAPANASKDHIVGEGHAHVYLNGAKVARVYGGWFHIDHLPEGDVMIEVALTSNDHRPLAVASNPLRVGVKVSNTTD